MRRLIAVFIPSECEFEHPQVVREFLDRFEVVRRILPPALDGTIYHLTGPNFPEVYPGEVIRMINPTIVKGEYLTIMYI